ncbi:MAG: PDZ domain-containing protein [Oscillospiraceae bacterium]|nr:PDZ domain-containing protein [Oscillospiraceae bacterium]
MNEENRSTGSFGRVVSYFIVAIVASLMTFYSVKSSPATQQNTQGISKLQELQSLLDQMYIGEIDQGYMIDMAAAGMVQGIEDRWSYYLPASEMQAYHDSMANSYVGIGITVARLEDGSGFQVQRVEPDSPAQKSGILPMDVIIGVDGVMVPDVGMDAALDMVSGEQGTDVKLTVLRDETQTEVIVTRDLVLVEVAYGKMVTDQIGYVHITNFDSRCAQESIAAIESLMEQGAQALIFDVRFNPGGYRHELVKLLDYLLPKGDLFKSVDYRGREQVDVSDASCVEVPMAVLINGDSYSAAEFFAAALKEYDYAVTVGQNTTGKGYFQQLYNLSDGSAVNLSVGKYFTPNGVSLAEVGGLKVDIPVDVDLETAALIYGQMLPEQDDAQLQAAVAAMQEKLN